MSFVVRQREVNYHETLGLIKRILLYCIKYGTTNDHPERHFDWSVCLLSGIKDLLTEDNLNKLTVSGGEFLVLMKKKTLTCIKKMINFYQEARGVVVDKGFTLIKDNEINFLLTLIKARGHRLDKEEKERQTSNIVDHMREGKAKLPPMQQAFNACEQLAVQKILKDIVRMGKTVADGTLRYICKRSCTRTEVSNAARLSLQRTRGTRRRRRRGGRWRSGGHRDGGERAQVRESELAAI